MRVLMCLRGRPGLGHVTPGVALAQAFTAQGDTVRILTYANGFRFLRASGWEACEELPTSAVYDDWPGLDLYDDGLRKVCPRTLEFGADVIVFGGEYLLGPLGPAAGIPTAMLYNPEIFEDSPRNTLPGALFASLFAHCEFLIPLRAPSVAPLLSAAHSIATCNLPSGPFVPVRPDRDPYAAAKGRLILLANGGGVDFPRLTESYSSSSAMSENWLRYTLLMTEAALQAAVSATGPGDLVVLYAALPESETAALRRRFARANVIVCEPSLSYYAALAHASLIVSRAGAGFLADIETTDAPVVLWPLAGHDEQAANAQTIATRRPHTRMVESAGQLAAAVNELLPAARAARVDSALAHDSAATRVARELSLRLARGTSGARA